MLDKMIKKLNDYKRQDKPENISFNYYQGIFCICGGQAEI
jgi:hypothetical protein